MEGFKNWMLSEMPVRSMSFIPNDPQAWSRDAKRKYGWDEKDAGILSSEAGVSKFKNLWANTEHNYDFYLVRTALGRKHVEIGEVTKEYVQEHLGLDIDPAPDAITIIFTNNTGAEKMPFTAWTAAHRIGHAFQRSNGMGGFPEWEAFRKELKRDLSNLLRRIYSYEVKNAYYGGDYPDADSERKLRAMATKIGTMRSARQNNLRNFFEFPHELLAQYLLTRNKIQFNVPAGQLIVRYAWGHPQGLWNRVKEEDRPAIERTIAAMADDYNDRISEVLNAAVGRMWMM